MISPKIDSASEDRLMVDLVKKVSHYRKHLLQGRPACPLRRWPRDQKMKSVAILQQRPIIGQLELVLASRPVALAHIQLVRVLNIFVHPQCQWCKTRHQGRQGLKEMHQLWCQTSRQKRQKLPDQPLACSLMHQQSAPGVMLTMCLEPDFSKSPRDMPTMCSWRSQCYSARSSIISVYTWCLSQYSCQSSVSSTLGIYIVIRAQSGLKNAPYPFPSMLSVYKWYLWVIISAGAWS
jgi:hypothetical protein